MNKNRLAYFRSQWGTNSHFSGAYSFHSMNTDKEGKANIELAKPLMNSNGKNVRNEEYLKKNFLKILKYILYKIVLF